MKRAVAIFTVFAFIAYYLLNTAPFLFATEFSSTSYKVIDPVLNESGGESTSTSYRLRSVVGELTPARSTSSGFQVRGGSLAFPVATAPVLTATAGAVQVPLSWTASVGSLGWTISGYDVCTGTVTDTYTTCSDVGNVTSSTRTSLTASTPYFFRVRGKDAFSNVVVRSNEATATPTSASSGGTSLPPSPPPSPTTADVIMSGRAYPGATVSLLIDGTVSQTIAAGADGTFSGRISTILIGRVYTFGASARDASGRTSVLFTRTINLASSLEIVNIFLSPTIALSSSTIVRGESLTLSGNAFPASLVRVQIPSGSDTTATANAAGAWSATIPTASLTPGTYTARAIAETAGSSSDQSAPQTFTVASVPTPPAPVCRGADLNSSGAGDGKVDAQDVSILIGFWGSRTFTSNPCVDIRRDGVVDLRDLSVLLFNWTG